MDMVSGAATYAQGDTILGTERCLDTWIDPEERAGTLQQRLLKKAEDSQQVKNGSLNGDGWRNFWETREYGQNLLHPLTEVKPGNRETCTRISYKNFFFFFSCKTKLTLWVWKLFEAFWISLESSLWEKCLNQSFSKFWWAWGPITGRAPEAGNISELFQWAWHVIALESLLPVLMKEKSKSFLQETLQRGEGFMR